MGLSMEHSLISNSEAMELLLTHMQVSGVDFEQPGSFL